MTQTDFVTRVVRDYDRTKKLRSAASLIKMTKLYFKRRYDEDIDAGRARKSSYLSTAQNSLSRIKKELREKGIAESYLKQIHLSKEDMAKLNKNKAARLHEEGANIPSVPADMMILDCRDILRNPEATRSIKVMALACLTGRRMIEILMTATFKPPKKPHRTNSAYWSCVDGLAKQRESEQSVEIPLLERRDEIIKSIHEIRSMFPPPPDHLPKYKKKQWYSKKYSKEISSVMHRYCPTIGKLHNFRKFYAAVCTHYFAENGASCSSNRVGLLGPPPTLQHGVDLHELPSR